MKKLLLLSILIFTSIARATTTVTGTLLTPAEAAVTANAYVRFELANYGKHVPRVIGSNVILPSTLDVYPDSNGDFSTTLTGNELIDPANTWYKVTYFKSGTRFYTCDVIIPSLLTGTVDTNGTAVTWKSGSLFPYVLVRGVSYSAGWPGSTITINSVVYTISTVNSAISLTLSATAGVQTGVAYSHGANTFDMNSATCLQALMPSAIPFFACTGCPPNVVVCPVCPTCPPVQECDLSPPVILSPPECVGNPATRTWLFPTAVEAPQLNTISFSEAFADPLGLTWGTATFNRWTTSPLGSPVGPATVKGFSLPGAIDINDVCKIQMVWHGVYDRDPAVVGGAAVAYFQSNYPFTAHNWSAHLTPEQYIRTITGGNILTFPFNTVNMMAYIDATLPIGTYYQTLQADFMAIAVDSIP